MHTSAMLETHPGRPVADPAQLSATIEALLDCAQACWACADACLAEDAVDDLRRCIRLNRDCAEVCVAAARILSQQTEADVEILQAAVRACEVACRSCGQECQRHAEMHEHCRVCAEVCAHCADACAQLLARLS